MTAAPARRWPASSCTASSHVPPRSSSPAVAEPGLRHQRGTVDFVAYTQPMIEAGTTRTGRWLRERRVRIALWVAVIEGLIAAFSHDIGRWTILVLAVIVLAFYMVAGRQIKWDVARQLSWIAATSQALAILVIIFAFILKLVAIVAIAVFAIVALVYLFSDRRHA